MDLLLAKTDDWTVLYIDGYKRMENHSLRLEDVLTEIMDRGQPINEINFIWFDEDEVEAMSWNFPLDRKDLPK